MNETLYATMNMIRAIAKAENIKISRGFADFFADRIKIATTEATLTGAVERLAGLVNCQIEYIGGAKTADFMACTGADDATAVLGWLRAYPRIAAMICMLKDEEDYKASLEQIVITSIETSGIALAAPAYDLPITITCLSPLSHGSDTKSGNATIFRRMQVLSNTGSVLNLPFYAGNALRGQMRDLLADHFLRMLGLDGESKVALWFWYALYSGGKLEQGSAEEKALAKELGNAGAVKIEGHNRLRNMVPPLSLLGSALGNRVIPGRINVGDFRPRCIEWGTGYAPAASLMEWTFLTRREDNENHQDGENNSMIVNAECLRSGVIMDGGIDISSHITEIEKSCLGLGLNLLADHGYIGADNRRGTGQVSIEFPFPKDDLYDQYLVHRKDEIMQYLDSVAALV